MQKSSKFGKILPLNETIDYSKGFWLIFIFNFFFLVTFFDEWKWVYHLKWLHWSKLKSLFSQNGKSVTILSSSRTCVDPSPTIITFLFLEFLPSFPKIIDFLFFIEVKIRFLLIISIAWDLLSTNLLFTAADCKICNQIDFICKQIICQQKHNSFVNNWYHSDIIVM